MTASQLARAIGISETSTYLKINGKRDMTLYEAKSIAMKTYSFIENSSPKTKGDNYGRTYQYFTEQSGFCKRYL